MLAWLAEAAAPFPKWGQWIAMFAPRSWPCFKRFLWRNKLFKNLHSLWIHSHHITQRKHGLRESPVLPVISLNKISFSFFRHKKAREKVPLARTQVSYDTLYSCYYISNMKEIANLETTLELSNFRKFDAPSVLNLDVYLRSWAYWATPHTQR